MSRDKLRATPIGLLSRAGGAGGVGAWGGEGAYLAVKGGDADAVARHRHVGARGPRLLGGLVHLDRAEVLPLRVAAAHHVTAE